MKIRTAISTAAVAVTAMMSTAAYAADLIIYTDGDYPPAYKNTDAGLEGSLVALLDEAAATAGLTLEYRVLPFKRTVVETEKTPNACNRALWRKAEREGKYAWVDLSAKDGFALFALPGSNMSLSALEDSFPHRTGATRGWGSTDALEAAGHPNLDLSNQNEGIAIKLNNKRVELWLSGIVSTPMVAQDAGIEVERVFTVSEVDLDLGCNLDSDPALLSRLQDALNTMVESGRAAEIAPGIFNS